MKKFITIVLTSTTVISLFGCTSNTNGGRLKTEFNLKAKVEYQNLSCEAEIKRDPYSMEITYNSPNTIKGLVYNFKDDYVDVTIEGVKTQIDNRDDIEDSSADIIYSSLEDAIPKPDAKKIEGLTKNGAYTLEVFNNIPKKLSLNEKNFTCEFESVD